MESDLHKYLIEIPSETSEYERLFLFKFIETHWGGKSNVVEIGPFLGGTTRCIAKGISDNPKAINNNSKLYTFDLFESYYDSVETRKIFDEIKDIGVIVQSTIDGLLKSPKLNFKDAFLALHSE